METLWSMSTTVRSADRIAGFLRTAAELDGEAWNRDTQIKYQVLLIRDRQYLNDPDNAQTLSGLSEEQCALLRDRERPMTCAEAEGIFLAKHYEDPPMRGRQSIAPLRKLGLVRTDGRVRITPLGRQLLDGTVAFDDFMLESMLKYQYPNPLDGGFRTWNTKPFICILRLIRRVNELCTDRGVMSKGLSTAEFGIFALSLRRYDAVDEVAERILKFRSAMEALCSEDERENFTREYILDYLADFNNPQRNVFEYADNMIRYLRQTKYIYIRGRFAHTYVDLEPRRRREIDAILEADDGSAREFTTQGWIDYIGTYGTYVRPFETVERLRAILGDIDREINAMEHSLSLPPSSSSAAPGTEGLKAEIERRREVRTRLQNRLIVKESHESTALADETLQALEYIRTHKRKSLEKRLSVELERWANVALNIIDDSRLVKPNAPMGDDNQPTFTAPAGVPDIECFYDSFNATCEVTMLRGCDQWFNEGQPVMRHLHKFGSENPGKPCYCIFVAPAIHDDTANTFFVSTKIGYDGEIQRIIPLTIGQFKGLLGAVRGLISQGRRLSHRGLQSLFEECTSTSGITGYSAWMRHVGTTFDNWIENIDKYAI